MRRLLRSRRARALALGLLGLAALLPAAGCASAARAAPEEAPGSGPADREERAWGEGDTLTDERAVGATTVAQPTPARPAEPGDEPLASDPYAERAGGPRGPEPAPDGLTRLLLPDGELTALSHDRRPALPARSKLALVCARDARLCHDAAALLSLDRELGGDPGLARVLSLGDVTGERIDLEGLARLAREREFDLLLVDVRDRDAEGERAGLLLHAGTGALLARYQVRDGHLPTSSTVGAGPRDLVQRVAEAYARAD